uniref:Pseudouridine-5'-monophosphatase n=1 Tax=Angiostrongylus cantonensis TaxID=6313 RepID=A0A0K0DFX1_ANGCA
MTVDNEVKLVIFDKDGTLVDFHRMWLPWAQETVQLLENATGRPVGPAVYKTLGVDPIQGKVSDQKFINKKSLFSLYKILFQPQTFGISAVDADAIVERGVPEASNGQTAPVCDLQKLFRELRSLGCKTALCTADSRYLVNSLTIWLKEMLVLHIMYLCQVLLQFTLTRPRAPRDQSPCRPNAF